MRREGRMSGWVRAYDYQYFADPLDVTDGRRPAAHTHVTGPTANGGYLKVSRKPTNHSKSTGANPYKEYGATAARRACKGANKFKHDEVKMYFLDLEGAEDRDHDVDM